MNITPVFTAFVDMFDHALQWLKDTRIVLGSYSVSFFALACIMIIVSVVLAVILPYFSGGDDSDD